MSVRRVLLFLTDLQIGGTPTVVRELALRLNRSGTAQVEVACLASEGPVGRQLRAQGVEVTPLQADDVFDLPRTVLRLTHLIRSHRIDTVLSFLIHANTLASMAWLMCPPVRFLQSIQTTQPYPRWHWRLQRWVHHAADGVVVPSESVAQLAIDLCDIPPQNIHLIPNAVDDELFDLVRQPGHPGTVRVGFLGRLDPVKRVGDLVQAMTHLPPSYHLHVFGDGAERVNLRDRIRNLNLRHRVTLHGTVESPASALAMMDVLVLPSQAEGFGLVLIEAMAAGIPVVATDAPGIRNVVHHEMTGLLVPVGDPSMLAQAIRRISEDVELQDRLVRRARQHVRSHYTWSSVLPKYQALLSLGSCDSAAC